MKKRIIRLSLVLALMLCLSVSVFAESQLWHITDDAGILTESQNIELETYAENISQDYGVGIYVVTVDNYEDYYDSAYETAWQIYHAYELGEGADRNGVILLLSMDNRQFATSSTVRAPNTPSTSTGRKNSKTTSSTTSAPTTGQTVSMASSPAAMNFSRSPPPVPPCAAALGAPSPSSRLRRASSR